MAAGLGFKTFVTGEVLTAADTNGYLMQGINVFASTAARDAAITAPAEGQFAFTKDTNSLWYYDGAAWVASGATGDIEGVTAGIGISGGGTSGTVTVTNSMATAIDAKGDLVAGTGADTFSRLAVGTNNHVLTADSAEATGLKWAAPSAAGANFSLISTTNTTSGTSVSITGLSGYNHLFFRFSGITSTATEVFQITLNSVSTGSKYSQSGLNISGQTTYDVNLIQQSANVGNSISCTNTSSTAQITRGYMTILGANSSGLKIVTTNLGVNAMATATANNYQGIVFDDTNVISSFQIKTNFGNFNAGTIQVYGSVN